MTPARIVGMGQAGAGDDGVGPAVLHAIQERVLPGTVQTLLVSEPSMLVELLFDGAPIVIVDAVIGSPVGQVMELSPADLAAHSPLRVSTHGISITDAIGLSRILSPTTDLPPIAIVAITVARPTRYAYGLSPEVADAVPNAARHALQRLGVPVTGPLSR